MADEKQVKSKKRVADHGEVFTAEREVNAMLDLVKQETERIDSRFLEPACGNGNFLAAILRRKLAVVKRRYRKSPADYEKNSVLAVSSIYGVDILEDNARECRERLYRIWEREYGAVCKGHTDEECRRSVQFILKRNIVCGNALSLKKVDGHGRDTDEPIVFSEWAFVTEGNLQRSDYTFDKLLEGDAPARDLFDAATEGAGDRAATQLTLFGQTDPPSDEGEFLRKCVSHYKKVWMDGD